MFIHTPFTKIICSTFRKDGHSTPHQTKQEMNSRFANIDVEIDEKYGHVDGIKSPEFRIMRGALLCTTNHNYDVRYNQTQLTASS